MFLSQTFFVHPGSTCLQVSEADHIFPAPPLCFFVFKWSCFSILQEIFKLVLLLFYINLRRMWNFANIFGRVLGARWTNVIKLCCAQWYSSHHFWLNFHIHPTTSGSVFISLLSRPWMWLSGTHMWTWYPWYLCGMALSWNNKKKVNYSCLSEYQDEEGVFNTCFNNQN